MQNRDGAILTMTITPVIEQKLKQEPFFLEIEMLQGERKTQPDGMIYYKIVVTDPDKQKLLKEFVLKMISESHLSNGN